MQILEPVVFLQRIAYLIIFAIVSSLDEQDADVAVFS